MSFFPSWQHSSVLKNEQIINPNQGEGWGGRAKETKRLDGGGKEGGEWKKERAVHRARWLPFPLIVNLLLNLPACNKSPVEVS